MRPVITAHPFPPSTRPRDDRRTLFTALRQMERLACTRTPDAHVHGRIKKWPSTVAKAKRLGVGLVEVLDRVGVRVIVRDAQECYQLIDLLHTSFAHLPWRFDDYVASPKVNGYQALHSILIDDRGAAFEVQVRTRAMHLRAQEGPAAHDEYKRHQMTHSITAAMVSRQER